MRIFFISFWFYELLVFKKDVLTEQKVAQRKKNSRFQVSKSKKAVINKGY